MIELRSVEDMPATTPHDVRTVVQAAFAVGAARAIQGETTPTALLRVVHQAPSNVSLHLLHLNKSPDPLEQIEAVVPGRDTPIRGTHLGCLAVTRAWRPGPGDARGGHGVAPPHDPNVTPGHMLVGLTVSGWTVECWCPDGGAPRWRLADPEEYGEAGGAIAHALNTLNLRFLSLRD